MYFLVFFVLAALVSWIFTRIWIPYVARLGVIDYPDETRRLHKEPKPLLGGVPLLASFIFVVVCFLILNNFGLLRVPFQIKLPLNIFYFLFSGCLVILIGGFFDDKYRLPPYITILFPVAAVLIAQAGGMHIKEITNPFGGVLNLEWHTFSLGALKIIWPAHIITFLWLLGLSYTTKILDGLDGLAVGMSGIGALMIVLLALFTIFYQPDIALLALIFSGVCFGFLYFNFFPAKIFLGEGGSLGVGFVLGALAILSGSKIMTTLLVLGAPVFDIGWTILRRLLSRSPVMKGDRKHLHYRLLNAGFRERSAVLFLYVVGFLFGILGLFLGSDKKLLLLGALFAAIILFLLYEIISKEKSSAS